MESGLTDGHRDDVYLIKSNFKIVKLKNLKSKLALKTIKSIKVFLIKLFVLFNGIHRMRIRNGFRKSKNKIL